MPEHGILRACSHPRGFRRPHLCAPSSFPSWVSIAPRPAVTQNKCPYDVSNLPDWKPTILHVICQDKQEIIVDFCPGVLQGQHF